MSRGESLAARVRRLRQEARLRRKAGFQACDLKAAEAAERAARKYEAETAIVSTERHIAKQLRKSRPAARAQVYATCMFLDNEPRGRSRRCKKTASRETAEEIQAQRLRVQDAKAAAKAALQESRTARRSVKQPCREEVAKAATSIQRAADIAEAERRQAAKMKRAGRRQPVSPSERASEEVQRARNDVEHFMPDALPLFDEIGARMYRDFVKTRERRERSGRTLSFGELFFAVCRRGSRSGG
ncbi:MAG: hypothetical protein IPK82_23290 [Polyangiaceae bacterium]|nr:hypothetical protein [Polyangiaceae bacterium]